MTATTFDQKGWQLQAPGGVATVSGVQYQQTFATYITGDAAAVVEAAGYLPPTVGAAPNALTMSYLNFPVGLVIRATMVCAGTPVIKTYIVTASSSSGVTLALQTGTAG